MSVTTQPLGVTERSVCQTCSWSSSSARLATEHVIAFPDHKVMTLQTTVSITMTQEQPTSA